MAALSTEVKAFIVQSLACFESPTKVIELVKAEYGIDVSRQQVSQYTPGNAMACSTPLVNDSRMRSPTSRSQIKRIGCAFLTEWRPMLKR